MERETRWLILQEVNRKGRAGVEELARSLLVRPATIHHHLPKLEREGLIRTQAERHGRRGRPRLVCSLTEQGQALFPQGYRWFADELLQAIAALDGPEKVALVFQQVGDRLSARYRPRTDSKDAQDRVQEVAKILTELGFDAAAIPVEHGFCLCDRNCPVLKIAERYPQLCAMELRLITTLLGKDVQRTEYRLDGAPVCTHRVTFQN
jgi:predicted ArsR family transcriptional regulator